MKTSTGTVKASRGPAFVLFFLAASLGFSGLQAQEGVTAGGYHGGNRLAIPALLEDTDPAPRSAAFSLTAMEGTHEFFPGTITRGTAGFNGGYLGPVIRVRRGEDVRVLIRNRLTENTSVHWHGLEIPGDVDGGPHYPIAPGESRNVRFTVDQPAGTFWFHPHPHGGIAEQVYRGLAGLFIVDDEISGSLTLPKTYGRNDIPLIIQDRRLGPDGELLYATGMRDLMMGMTGDTMTVNGTAHPVLEVAAENVRFRLVNGSNARTYRIALNNAAPMYQIASDSGFLAAPIELQELSLSPGERAEIVIDFSGCAIGEELFLEDPEIGILKIVVSRRGAGRTELPPRLAGTAEPFPAAIATRRFVMAQMGPNVTINGLVFSMDRIDERVGLGTTEIWEVSNAGMGGMGGGMMGRGMGGMMGSMTHPFHIHGVRFRILDRDGAQPSPGEQGWKDTVAVPAGGTVRLLVTFRNPGTFVYHCHILEHDDAGMMGAFEVR